MRADASQKSMGSYELFAWRDAMELASWLEADFDIRAMRKAFEQTPPGALAEFEANNREFIAELISKSPSQRLAYLRKIGKDVDTVTRGMIIVFAIIGQVRAKKIIELRDRFRTVLTPGASNRSTCAGLYAFQWEVAAHSTFAWPHEVFEAYGGNSGLDEE